MPTNRKQEHGENDKVKFALYEAYRRDRAEIMEHRILNINMLDKTLLTVNTGAFVVSFTYVFQLFTKGNPHVVFLLIAGWIAMGLAIMANIFAQHLSLNLCNHRIMENDLSYKCESGRCEIGEEELLSNIRKKNLRGDKFSAILSNSQVFLTVISIVLILIFVTINAYMFPN